MPDITRSNFRRPQIYEQAQAHNSVYDAIERSMFFRQILVQAMAADYPPESAQYSFVGMQGLRWLAERVSMAPTTGVCIDIGCGEGLSAPGCIAYVVAKLPVTTHQKKQSRSLRKEIISTVTSLSPISVGFQ